jgi:hypothetical protein
MAFSLSKNEGRRGAAGEEIGGARAYIKSIVFGLSIE